jgi:NADP-dependent 3-hydroxy acid dehydrogenase YdfG
MATSLQILRESNDLIPNALPSGLVAVFAGATSGIGAATLKAFVKRAQKPRAYIIGRSEQRAQAIIDECKALNPGAEVFFFAADMSLMKNTDSVCEKIKAREKRINLLMLTVGDPDFDNRGMSIVLSNGGSKLTRL